MPLIEVPGEAVRLGEALANTLLGEKIDCARAVCALCVAIEIISVGHATCGRGTPLAEMAFSYLAKLCPDGELACTVRARLDELIARDAS